MYLYLIILIIPPARAEVLRPKLCQPWLNGVNLLGAVLAGLG